MAFSKSTVTLLALLAVIAAVNCRVSQRGPNEALSSFPRENLQNDLESDISESTLDADVENDEKIENINGIDIENEENIENDAVIEDNSGIENDAEIENYADNENTADIENDVDVEYDTYIKIDEDIEDDSHSVFNPYVNFTCYDCTTREIRKPDIVIVVKCKSNYKPYCYEGFCSHVPAPSCAKIRS